MTVLTREYLYNTPWDIVTRAYLNKYPNINSIHVTEVDTYERTFNKNILNIKRFLAFSVPIPIYIKHLGKLLSINCDKNYVLEDITIDNNNKTLTTYSKNLISNNIISISETISYIQHYNNTTLFKQTINISTPYKILENFCYNTLLEKSSKNIETIHSKILELNNT